MEQELKNVTIKGTASVEWPEGHLTEEEMEKAHEWELQHLGEISSEKEDE